jgi:Flp pilus assembly protein TadG
MHRLVRLLGVKGTHRRTRGQSLVEFALVLPIFILMLFGLVDMARLVHANSALSQAAREGARVASVQAYWVGETGTDCGPGGPTCPANEAAFRANVLSAANGMMDAVGTIANAQLHVSCTGASASAPSGAWTSPPNSCSSQTVRQAPGSRVSVRVAMSFQPITPIIGQLIGILNLSGSVTMSIN